MKRAKIIKVIYDCIDIINLEQDTKIAKDMNSILFGHDGELDSLGLVNLIVTVEEAVNDAFDTDIVLADEKAMSRKNSPFLNVTTLAEYLVEILE